MFLQTVQSGNTLTQNDLKLSTFLLKEHFNLKTYFKVCLSHEKVLLQQSKNI